MRAIFTRSLCIEFAHGDIARVLDVDIGAGVAPFEQFRKVTAQVTEVRAAVENLDDAQLVVAEVCGHMQGCACVSIDFCVLCIHLRKTKPRLPLSMVGCACAARKIWRS